ncbi:DNA-binding bromodomain-containing protein isoform 1 [Galdieria sulphuraria]|uniref:DNA-binding bromodomain-containing protein isoform 1 n=1 Tax=Galdieria sulphuraria TaxID=130081 RepID=M2XV88_GALSU|nr:DNA-binding bromodomain-containing protein isoform 2 [Galdieria sulphuraria]XP_005703840.1 DNA-binding bromodomain-containing protein isoform 1 [Galdieria sulphuraria]EME27319.1 DNA-binding bromodomain-containing protein isoform 2 [Galdieria sulphuraria]EME27320.1 DNA-binding bromodomain-containing protein isoform 1 [Galdieria sulphuraria]|eukprot:XP_005703839.1 DNA-binding bromodomain-containing protein isoform 2 [Galdieria sulphuraria]
MAPRGPWALTLRSLAKLSPEEREPQHCLIVAGNEILEKLGKRDTQDIFAEPVDTSVVTDYLTIVKKPMDLGTVREKLNRAQYTCVEELREDIDLIWDNCCLYNAPDTEFYLLAVKLREVTVKLFEQLEVAFQEIGLEPPRRKSLHKASVEKNEQQNLKQDSPIVQGRYKPSEGRVQSDDTFRLNHVDQQESVEQAKPLVLNGPKRKRTCEEEHTDSLEKGNRSSSVEFKLLKYTHYYPLLQTMFSNHSESSPLQESAKVVAEKVLVALEGFFQASAPAARMLLSRWLNNEESRYNVAESSEENVSRLERKRILAKLLLQQAGFQPSEISYDLEEVKDGKALNVSKLLWNVYRSNLLEQDRQLVSDSDSYSSRSSMQTLEKLICQQVLNYTPQSLLLGSKDVACQKEQSDPSYASSF